MKLKNRNKEIIRYCRNKNVLHLGCVGFADLDKEARIKNLKNTLHYKIYKEAKQLTGIDYSKEVINSLKNIEGFDNVYYGDAEKLEKTTVESKFDLIVVGDLIEHLSNPGLMLEGIKRFCDKNTEIIITTPNSFGVASFIRYTFNKFREGNEHVMTFNRYNISNLLNRHKFIIINIDTCYQEHAKSIKMFNILKFVLGQFPKFGGTLFVLAKKDTN